MKITHYKLSLLFTRCTVLMPLPHSFATSRMEYPLRSRLITSLYSAFTCSAVFTEPTLRPSFPPFSIYRFLPDCNRNEILSRSNCSQEGSVAIIIWAKRDGCPSSSNNVITTLQKHKKGLLYIPNNYIWNAKKPLLRCNGGPFEELKLPFGNAKVALLKSNSCPFEEQMQIFYIKTPIPWSDAGAFLRYD